MNEQETVFREYQSSDYASCETLVSDAWKFDSNFKPQKLANVAKYIYTKGSVLGSNYRMVVEVNGNVIGFIFGLNEYSKKPKGNILFGLGVLWRLIFIKNGKFNKKNLINALGVHAQNRGDIVTKGRSEIILFVVSNEYQGKGYGTRLWTGFKEQCLQSGVGSIIVETNKLEASSFYEQIGFRHLADFTSPLHELTTKGGQACMYEFKL